MAYQPGTADAIGRSIRSAPDSTGIAESETVAICIKLRPFTYIGACKCLPSKNIETSSEVSTRDRRPPFTLERRGEAARPTHSASGTRFFPLGCSPASPAFPGRSQNQIAPDVAGTQPG